MLTRKRQGMLPSIDLAFIDSKPAYGGLFYCQKAAPYGVFERVGASLIAL